MKYIIRTSWIGILLLIFQTSFSQIIPGPYDSHSTEGNRLIIHDIHGNNLIIQAYSNTLIKILYLSPGSTEDSSMSVVMEPQDNLTAEVSIQEDKLSYTISGNKIRIMKSNLEVLVFRDEDPLISGSSVHIGPFQPEITLQIDPNDALFGGGSRAIPMDLRGRELAIYNQQRYGYGWEEPDMNICIPYIVTSGKYAIFFDNHQPASLDLTQEGSITFSPEKGITKYWVLLNESHEGILSDVADLFGHQPLPPRWGLGYIQSRFGYQNRQEAEDIVDAMLAEGFPMDVIILDLYWQGEVSEMGNLEWDWSRFPVPHQMVDNFNQKGIKTILITDPYITKESFNYDPLDVQGLFCKNNSGNTYSIDDFWAGPAGLLDFHNDDTWNWMWQKYEARMGEGIAGWWCDLGEPEKHPDDILHTGYTAGEVHNVYSLYWAEQLFNSFTANYPDKRLFNLIRSGYAGMQRYSSFPWSGDVQRSFDGMRAQIPIVLSMGMCGIPFMHYDMTGFTGSIDEEIYTRWFQMGSFSPIMRCHGTGEAPEPVFREESTKNIVREYSKLRHRLLPYTYTLAWEATTKGISPARPMFFYDDSQLAFDFADYQYFWGKDFLIAPVFNADQVERHTYMPDGQWIDFDSDLTYEGGQVNVVPSPIETMPIMVRAGAIIPLSPDFQSIDRYSTDQLLIHHYPDPEFSQNAYTMYHDDGESAHSLQSENYELLHFSSEYEGLKLEFMLQSDPMNLTSPPARDIEIVLHRCSKPEYIRYEYQDMIEVSSKEEYDNSEKAWFADLSTNYVWVKFIWDGNNTLIETGEMPIVKEYASTDHLEMIADVRIYPNPAREFVNLEFTSLGNYDMMVSILDMAGNMLIRDSLGSVFTGIISHSLDISSLSPGAYMIVLNTGGRKHYKKLLVI